MPDSAERDLPGLRPTSLRDLNDLYYFARVVDDGGFSAAARALEVSKSHLSRRVAALEQRLGLRLLQRSTRKLVPTEAGERYLGFCRIIAETAQEADEAMLDLLAEPTGPVTLSAPIGLAQAVLPVVLPGFLRAYPKVTLRVHATAGVVDLYQDRVDIALRVREKVEEDANVIVRRFGVSELSLVASRDYIARCGAPSTPTDLREHTTVSWDAASTGADTWRLYDPSGQALDVVHYPRLVCPEFQALIESVRCGEGIGLLPHKLWRRIDAGRGDLVPLLPDWRAPEGIVYGAYASRRGMVPAVRVLIDYLTEHLTALMQSPGGELLEPPHLAMGPRMPSAASVARATSQKAPG